MYIPEKDKNINNRIKYNHFHIDGNILYQAIQRLECIKLSIDNFEEPSDVPKKFILTMGYLNSFFSIKEIFYSSPKEDFNGIKRNKIIKNENIVIKKSFDNWMSNKNGANKISDLFYRFRNSMVHNDLDKEEKNRFFII